MGTAGDDSEIGPQVRVSPSPSPPLSARLVSILGGRATGNEGLRVFTTIGRHRRLSRWWLPFAGALLLRGRLPRAESEILILRTAWYCDCWYEWVQHAPLARRVGLDAAAVTATSRGPSAPVWTARQRLLVQAADEILEGRVVTDDTWAALSAALTVEECIEVCFLVGHYEMLAGALNSLGVEPEATALAHLDPTEARLAAELRANLVRSRRRAASSPHGY